MGAYFEPIPKKLELIVDPAPGRNLLTVGARAWADIVEAAEARIVALEVSATNMMAILSESSLFVRPDRMVMITCGRSRLARAAAALANHVPATAWRHMRYVRPPEIRPDLQLSSFAEDVKLVSEFLPGESRAFETERGPYRVFDGAQSTGADPSRHLEIQLHGISAWAEKAFAPSAPDRAPVLKEILRLIPAAHVQEHAFSPHGYSANFWCDERCAFLHVSPESTSRHVHLEFNFAPDPGFLKALLENLDYHFKPSSTEVVAAGVRGQSSVLSHWAGDLKQMECGRSRFERIILKR